MTKKEAEALKEEIAKLREKVEALEKEPRKYEFHYHPPIFVNPYPVLPYAPPIHWWHYQPTTTGIPGILSNGISPPGATSINRLEATCVN